MTIGLSARGMRGSGRGSVDVGTLRALFRNLQAFQAAREEHNVTEVTSPSGVTYSIFDVEYLYGCRDLLSPRQRQAIELFLYHNIRERDVAEMMGVSPTNPIAIYATQGLTKICELISEGSLPGYREQQSSGV